MERPRVSTSGGQSGGGEDAWGRGVVVEEGEEVSALIMAAQEATEVQERHLFFVSVFEAQSE